MIKDENDYKTVIYEQPFHSHIHENHLEFLLDYHTRPRNYSEPTEQKVNEVTISHEPAKNQKHVHLQITFTKMYQKIHKEKNLHNSISPRKSKKYRIPSTRP